MQASRVAFAATAVVFVSLLSAQSAPADILLPGSYNLKNHPDGSEVPPPYGVRLDEIVDVTGGHDVFTCDFEAAGSNMQMTINPAFTQIRIFGQAYGGRDNGSGYAVDAYLGFWQFDFTYNIGVGLVPGDDDVWVSTANHSNFGTITLPNSSVVNVTDEKDGNFSFRFGDENDDNGHRGFPGLSGWGWMTYVEGGASPTYRHAQYTDWLFTADYNIPAPGSMSLLGAAGLVAIRRGRR